MPVDYWGSSNACLLQISADAKFSQLRKNACQRYVSLRELAGHFKALGGQPRSTHGDFMKRMLTVQNK